MATESVATPQVSIPAQVFIDHLDAMHELIDNLVGVDGVLAILNEKFEEDTPLNCAITCVSHLVHNCREAALDMDWPYSYRSQAEAALGIPENAA
jgi:hypothetical protein